jgi:pimeloyl-ACP methyl ester carboxylesterase
MRRPERFRSVVLGGVGDALVNGVRAGRAAAIADAMDAPEAGTVENVSARAFRVFAERTGNDLVALAAMQRAPREYGARDLSGVKLPVLVVVGDKDTLVGSGENLAALIPGAKLVTVAGDHLGAVGNPALKQAIVDFLSEHSPTARPD